MESLTAEFAARGPWITRFLIDGEEHGGDYAAAADHRLDAFLKRFPHPGRVLELGCLEGGHTFALARVAREVVAIEARADNLAKACWLASRLGADNIRFVEGDAELFPLESLGPFDVVYNVGLLYHLQKPWELLAKMARLSSTMFLWTHVAPRWRRTKDRARFKIHGYMGERYLEIGASDPLSGVKQDSFWPTEKSLKRMLADAGFSSITILGEEPKHPNGPALMILAQTDSSHCSNQSV